MANRIKLDGKYEIIEDLTRGEFRALRYGEDWRSLVGDNLILALVSRLEKAESLLSEAHSVLDDIHGYNEDVYQEISDYFEENE